MNELQELYREVILDHNRRPRNFGELADADSVIEGVNPLCGDKLTLVREAKDGTVTDIKLQGQRLRDFGCVVVADDGARKGRDGGRDTAAVRQSSRHVDWCTANPTGGASTSSRRSAACAITQRG